MGIIKQYKPAFFTGFKKAEVQFETKEELLNIDWVKNFSDPIYGMNHFHQFSVSNGILMAEYDNGGHWHVVGFITDSEVINEFPVWEAKSKEA